METFLTPAGIVALGELGDKTQLLALMLTARFKRPWIIIAGIFIATLLNHLCAGLAGFWIRTHLSPDILRWVLGGAFIAIGLWVLIPDKLDEPDALKQQSNQKSAWGVFAVTVIAFFLAEMGDKTQIATVGLAARFDSLTAVIAGTTVGMLIADGPVVWLGHATSCKLPLKWIHGLCAILFIAIGAYLLYFGFSSTTDGADGPHRQEALSQTNDALTRLQPTTLLHSSD